MYCPVCHGPRQDRTPTAPLLAAVTRAIKEGRSSSWGVLAREVGMVQGDSSRLKRTLGALPHVSGPNKGAPVFSKTLPYGLAVEIARAAGVDPVDAGL
jgi:hypothetical protein